MSGNYEQSDSKAGFYYDLKFVIGLLYVIFIAVSVASLGLSDSAISGMPVLVFISIIIYLDLQEFIEARVPRYGWKCSRNDYKIASAFLMISLFLIPMGKYFLDSGIAVKSPLFFFLSFGLISIPTLLGIVFSLTCYLNFGRSVGFWKDEEIAKALLDNSYFYRKTRRRSTQKTSKLQ